MTTVGHHPDNAKPKRRIRRSPETVAEVEFFLKHTGDNSHAVALALGMKRDSLHQALCFRAGRRDLWELLTARDVSLEPEPWDSILWLPEHHPKRRAAELDRLEREKARRAAGVPTRRRGAA